MSYDLEILSETSYQNFLNQLNNNLSYEEIEEFFNNAVIYDTSFSYFSGADRLLDVINEAEPYSDDFTKEFNHNMYRMRKNQLIEIVHDPVNDYLREKWAFALNALDSDATVSSWQSTLDNCLHRISSLQHHHSTITNRCDISATQRKELTNGHLKIARTSYLKP